MQILLPIFIDKVATCYDINHCSIELAMIGPYSILSGRDTVDIDEIDKKFI